MDPTSHTKEDLRKKGTQSTTESASHSAKKRERKDKAKAKSPPKKLTKTPIEKDKVIA